MKAKTATVVVESYQSRTAGVPRRVRLLDKELNYAYRQTGTLYVDSKTQTPTRLVATATG